MNSAFLLITSIETVFAVVSFPESLEKNYPTRMMMVLMVMLTVVSYITDRSQPIRSRNCRGSSIC